MRLLLALPFLLAACDSPFEEAWPRQQFTLEQDERSFLVHAQYDPIERSWFTQVSEPGGALSYDDRERAIFLIENQLGAELCDSGKMVYEVGQLWSAGGKAHFHKALGTWQIVADCT